MKEKELVTLRKRPMKNGGNSLYLDYSVDGIRYKDYLQMYVVPEKTKIDKIQNEETLKVAMALKARKIVELQNDLAGFKKRKKDVWLDDYLKTQQTKYKERGKVEYAKTLGKLINWLGEYGNRASLRMIGKEYILALMDFMRDNGLAESTINLYFQTLGTIFNNAVREEIIDVNPIKRIDISQKPKPQESEREYLTYEEVQKLANTPCGNEATKSAFLFSCFAGLRLCDIELLTWDMIRKTAEGWEVETRQNKTKQIVYVPLSANAMSFLPERSVGRIWRLPCRMEINRFIDNWVKAADIKKHITYHCSRHTYATMLLTYGSDLYTVSKLLGHSDIGVTQVYAKIIDKKRKAAVDAIPVLGGKPKRGRRPKSQK